MAQLIPIAAGKAKQKGADALTGDVYVRRWTSAVGKGKKKREVSHELHVNPLMVVATAAAGAATALMAGVGLWVTQQKIAKSTGKDVEITVVIQFDKPYGTPVRYTYYLGAAPIKVSTTSVPWNEVLPAYYQRRGYSHSSTKQISADGMTLKAVATFTTEQARYGITEREGFGINLGGIL